MIAASTSVRRYARSAAGVGALVVALAASGMAQQAVVSPDELHVGDRVAVTIEGPLAFSDTLVVRAGQILRIPNMADISMAGVKRSDTERYLAQQVAKYVRNAAVHATPLIQIAVLGQVGRPGFFTMPSDVLLSDAIMRAGGPTPMADLGKTVVQRQGTEIIGQRAVSGALASGQTLDDLRIAPGDEVIVGEKSRFGFGQVLAVLSVLIPLTGLIIALSRRH